MNDNEQDPLATTDGNIGQIRDILFGRQMRDYDTRFDEIRALLEQAEKRLETASSESAAGVQQAAEGYADHIANKLGEKLEALSKENAALEASVNALRDELQTELVAKQQLAGLLRGLADQISNGKDS